MKRFQELSFLPLRMVAVSTASNCYILTVAIGALIISNYFCFFCVSHWSTTKHEISYLLLPVGGIKGKVDFNKAILNCLTCLDLEGILCFNWHCIHVWHCIFCCWVFFAPNSLFTFLQYLDLGVCNFVNWLIICWVTLPEYKHMPLLPTPWSAQRQLRSCRLGGSAARGDPCLWDRMMWEQQGRLVRGARPTLIPWLRRRGTAYTRSSNKIRKGGGAFTAHSIDNSSKLLRYPVVRVPRISHDIIGP